MLDICIYSIFNHILHILYVYITHLQVFCHRNDKHTPIEETVRAMDYVINKGQAFYWGTSEWTAEEIQIAKLTAQRLNLIEPIVEQCQYNLIQRKAFEVSGYITIYYYSYSYQQYKQDCPLYCDLILSYVILCLFIIYYLLFNFQVDYKRLFTEGGYGSTVWSPLGGGILTGKYSKSKEGSLPENSRLSIDRLKWLTDLFLSGAATNMKWEDLIDRVDKLGELAKELGCTLPQLALAWVLANNHVSTALIGARNPTQLLENLGALDVVPKVTKEVNEKIDKIMGTAPTHLPDHTRRSERGIPESRP